jgi:hypothetical protein
LDEVFMSLRAVRLPLLLISTLLGACGADPDPVGGGGPLVGGDAGAPVLVPDAGLLFDSGTQPVKFDGGVIYTDGGVGEGGCGSVRAQTEPAKAAVDVLWVIDDSFSMLPQVLPVGDNMGRFMNGVRTSGANIEVMMVTGPIIGTYLAGAITDMNYHWITAPVQSNDAYMWALNMYPDWSKFRRPGAPLHIIIVTDDSSNMPAATFLPMMEAKVGGKFTLHAVAADGPLSGGSCGGAGPGTEYFNAATTTGGEKLKLCENWAPAFEKLQSSVVASVPLPCDYAIPPPPNGERVDPAAVQVVYTPVGGADDEFPKAPSEASCGDFKGWYFDDNNAPSKVVMCPKACETVKSGGALSIGFGCAPSVVLQ